MLLSIEQDDKDVLDLLRCDIIGISDGFLGPYGVRGIVYCDFIASGRALKGIEDYMRDQVLSTYANTHTIASNTGMQTTHLRNEARRIIGRSVNSSDNDVVLFTGSGTTAAVNKLVHILATGILASSEAIVFVGVFEHHSNILPWREMSNCTVVTIPEDMAGRTGVDLTALEKALLMYQHSGKRLIGSFSAASNVTGIKTSTVPVVSLLKKYGALSFWDYATAAGYLDIDVSNKDAVFFSPHKLLGGVGGSGVLVCKLHLFTNSVPNFPGGGTVLYVTEDAHKYVDSVTEREEGGTPNILGDIRAGLTFQLREAIGIVRIEKIESLLSEYVFNSLREIPNLIVLGNPKVPARDRIPIVSFLVRHGSLYLHHDFVCRLLNDLFGIQSRSGCACAGPYSVALLGLTETHVSKLESQLIDHHLIMKPGFTRLNFSYTMSLDEVEFVLAALKFIAVDGWKLLPQYSYSVRDSSWCHTSLSSKLVEHKCLSDIKFLSDTLMSWDVNCRRILEPHIFTNEYREQVLEFARSQALVDPTTLSISKEEFPRDLEDNRWFLLPTEASALILGEITTSHLSESVFLPNNYFQSQ